MALQQSDILKKVRNKVYNTGLGERPSIRQGTGVATVSGDTVTFALASGEGAKTRAGHTLHSYGSSTTADAYGFYVLGVSGDNITAVNGYDGTAIANSASVPGLLEQQAPISEYDMHVAIDDIVGNYLYPEVYDVVTDSFTPNITTGQSNGDANYERILHAWQYVGPKYYRIPCKLEHNVDTSMFASGSMLVYDAIYNSTAYFSAVQRVSIANSTNSALEELIAKGAAALVLEGPEAAAKWESAKNDSRDRADGDPASRSLWQSFYTAKRQFTEDITRETVLEWVIDRG